MSVNKNHFNGILSFLDNPNLKVISSNEVVVIKDKYPKAEHHFLVLPLENISTVYNLRKCHLPLLDELEFLAQNVIETTGIIKDNFKIGYHLSPSILQRLHLHVISNDFNSDCLKTKTHWNSFNTDFLLSPKYVRDTLENNGKLEKPNEDIIKKLLRTELKCHKCTFLPKNMPDLKRHLLQHIE